MAAPCVGLANTSLLTVGDQAAQHYSDHGSAGQPDLATDAVYPAAASPPAEAAGRSGSDPGRDAATGWLLADPTTRAETATTTARVREGYRFQDPLIAETPHTAADKALDSRRADQSDDVSPSGKSAFSYSTWISGLRVNLIGDYDNDGYYRGFSLDIDVDTSAGGLDVYAVIYLQRQGESPRALHTTRTFYISGTRRADEYTLEIELLDDYRAGQYDLGIDIIDAVDNRLLDSVTAWEFTSLGGLPLEAPDGVLYDDCYDDSDGFGYTFDDDCDANDGFYDGFYDDYSHSESAVGVAYAGSAGGGLLLALSTAGWLRRRYRR